MADKMEIRLDVKENGVELILVAPNGVEQGGAHLPSREKVDGLISILLNARKKAFPPEKGRSVPLTKKEI